MQVESEINRTDSREEFNPNEIFVLYYYTCNIIYSLLK